MGVVCMLLGLLVAGELVLKILELRSAQLRDEALDDGY